MLIEKLHKDMMTARLGSDQVAKNLLITLYSEASRVGKDKRNGPSTDDEVVATAKKFVANAEETSRILKERGQDDSVQQHEIAIVKSYLPTQLSRDELAAHVDSMIAEMTLTGPKAMGAIMAQLKARFSGQYDGKVASEVVKSKLV